MVFSVPLLHTALPAWNLGRLLLWGPKETDEVVGAGAVRLPCGMGLVCSPLGFFPMEAGKAAVQVSQRT